MITDILRFNREAPLLLEKADNAKVSLDQYLAEHGYSREFMDHYIVPMGAAIWSAGVAQMREFPAASAVLSVERDGRREEVRFDHVIMAGHGDQSLFLLSDASSAEREILGAFSYQENKTVLHTDTSVLPRRRRAWASWNYLVPAQEQSTVAVTYDMNILQSLEAPETFLVSLNMDDRIAPDKILKKITYHHPIYTARAVAAQTRWGEVSRARTSFCGAYWGFGFHEDGVASAHRVCESLGVKPWL
jgi:predicted NAD/FAD-binding protein